MSTPLDDDDTALFRARLLQKVANQQPVQFFSLADRTKSVALVGGRHQQGDESERPEVAVVAEVDGWDAPVILLRFPSAEALQLFVSDCVAVGENVWPETK